jgi:hypothetical protein
MKSLADVAGLNKQSNVKIGYDYSFDVMPDAKQLQSEIFSGKEPSGLIKVRPYVIRESAPAVGSYNKDTNTREEGTLDEITKQSYMGVPRTILEDTRNLLTSKPFGDPAESKTLMGKVGTAAANTAFKALGAPLQLAGNVVASTLVSPFVGGVNTQESRRAGTIYKSSQEELNAKQTNKNIDSVRESMLQQAQSQQIIPATSNVGGLMNPESADSLMQFVDKGRKTGKTATKKLTEDEAYGKQLMEAEKAREAAQLAEAEAYNAEESRKRAAANPKKEKDFTNPQTDQDVADYITFMLENNQDKIDKNSANAIKKNIVDYINSPFYAQRQANFPEQYIEGGAEGYQKNKYESSIAKKKREQRIANLNTTPIIINKNDEVSDLNYFDPKSNKLLLSERNMPEVVAHELTHASTAKNEGKLIDSDRINAKYWDSVVAKSKKSPLSAGLNRAEMDKFFDLAKDADESGAGDTHADKMSNMARFTGEQYGDLMGVRNLLYKAGITKSFGESLDKSKMEKALNNKKINSNPVFKRFLFRYGADNIIDLNNTIAMNNKGGNNDTLNA